MYRLLQKYQFVSIVKSHVFLIYKRIAHSNNIITATNSLICSVWVSL